MSTTTLPFVGQFSNLADVVPLSTPYSIAISIGNICDFRCEYCVAKDVILSNKQKPHLTTLDEFRIILSQLKEFEEPIRQICFVSSGETILNKDLPKMIYLAKKENVVNKVKIVTNANMLTKEYADQLIDAGLDILKISLQGLSDESYQEICHPPKAFSFEKFKSQIQYFYDSRKSCKVHVKMIDIALKENEEQIFYDMFSPMADNIFIEKCFDKDNMGLENINRYNTPLNNCNICAYPFYYMNLDVWGNVFPCCVTSMKEIPAAIGNIYKNSLKELWEGAFRTLQLDSLQSKWKSYTECNGCKSFRAIEKECNILDGREDEILSRYK